eukprot:scaffold2899_cov85-Skeletonema_dohrnii-CCMP3373.AAC.10
MGRKRNQGKARRAAKARANAMEEAEEESNNNQRTNGQQQLLVAQMQQLQIGNSNFLQTSGSDATKCYHGFKKMDNMCIDFVIEFREAVHEAGKRGNNTLQSLMAANNATLDKYEDVWYMEQWLAAEFHKTQATINWPKVEAMSADSHTRVKFLRKRIPCKCLDKKYDEVKSITKMGICFNPQCPHRRVERNKTMYCSGCRCITYCSRACQKADWKAHRQECNDCVAKFEAEKQS